VEDKDKLTLYFPIPPSKTGGLGVFFILTGKQTLKNNKQEKYINENKQQEREEKIKW